MSRFRTINRVRQRLGETHSSLLLNQNDHGRVSYSQCGEDLIVDYILSILKITQPTYLDIGAHHPTYLSNTYFFYTRGCDGVCVEPDPVLCAGLQRKRKRDRCLNVGAGELARPAADFFVMTYGALNTFSKQVAEQVKQTSHDSVKIERVVKIPLMTLNGLIEQNFDATPNFISVDVEGLDFDVLGAFDFQKYRPEVFCIETVSAASAGRLSKDKRIRDLLEKNNYFLYADTFVNSIFVPAELGERLFAKI